MTPQNGSDTTSPETDNSDAFGTGRDGSRTASSSGATRRSCGFTLGVVATIVTMAAASAPSLFYPQIADHLDLLPVATTVVFAVYAFTLLATLLWLGSLSDSLGRRPVVMIGAVLLAASLGLFWSATSLLPLLVARAIQGVAAGLLIPTLSAMLIDFQPADGTDDSAVWNTMAPMLGLGSGALGAAVLLDTAAHPDTTVFGTLIAAFFVIAVVVWAPSRSVPRGVH